MKTNKLFLSFTISLILVKTNIKSDFLIRSIRVYPHDMMYVNNVFPTWFLKSFN